MAPECCGRDLPVVFKKKRRDKKHKTALGASKRKKYNRSSQMECHWGKNSPPGYPQDIQNQSQKDKEGHMGFYVRPYMMG